MGYPNRDSSFYGDRYGMPECETALRGTLRYEVCRAGIVHGMPRRISDDMYEAEC